MEDSMLIHLIKDGELYIMTVPKGSIAYEKLEDKVLEFGETFRVPNDLIVNNLKIVKDETEE